MSRPTSRGRWLDPGQEVPRPRATATPTPLTPARPTWRQTTPTPTTTTAARWWAMPQLQHTDQSSEYLNISSGHNFGDFLHLSTSELFVIYLWQFSQSREILLKIFTLGVGPRPLLLIEKVDFSTFPYWLMELDKERSIRPSPRHDLSPPNRLI